MSHPQNLTPQDSLINDKRFFRRVSVTLEVKDFLLYDLPEIDAEKLDSINLCGLDQLRYSSRGRLPTLEEWSLLDRKSIAINSCLNDERRRRIRIRQLGAFFGIVPVLFLVISVLSILWYVFFPRLPIFIDNTTWYRNAAYLLGFSPWAISQGGLGASAFIATRVIARGGAAAADSDSKTTSVLDGSDFTDANYLRMRIVLGCLFGFLFGFPIAARAFTFLLNSMYLPDPAPPLSPSDFVMLFIPFLVGFNTSLVLAILNRLVSAIQVLFGVSSPEGGEPRPARPPLDDVHRSGHL